MEKYEDNFKSKPKTFQDYMKTIISNIYYVIAITAIVIIFGVYQSLTTEPVYQSQANLMIASNEDANQILDIRNQLNNRMIANHIEMLRSRGLKTKVIIALWESPVRDSLYIFGAGKSHVESQKGLGSFIKNIGEKIVSGISGLFRKSYRVPNFNPGNRNGGSLNNDPWQQNLERQLPEGLTRSKLENLIGRLDIDINPVRETSIINITARSRGKKQAEYILNKFIDIYNQSDQNRSAKEITHMVNFLEQKIESREKELQQARMKLKNYQENAGIYGMEQGNRALLEQAIRIESQYHQISIERESKKQELQSLRSKLSSEEKQLVNELSNTVNSELRALRQELAQKQARMVKTSNQYGDSHAEIQNLEKEIKRLKSEIEKKTQQYVDDGIGVADPLSYSRELVSRIIEAESELTSLKLREQEFKKLVELYNQKLKVFPEKQLTYAKLQRELDVLERNYDFLRQRYEESKISQELKSGNVKVIDQASIAEKIKPKPVKDAFLAVILGLCFGFVFVIIKDNLNNKVETVEDLERYGLPLIGNIPYVKTNGEPNPSGIDKSVVTFHKPYSQAAELYRKLRTNIQFSSIEKEIKSLIITSNNPKEGKTTLSANLGIIYANIGKSVLLVDADLRKSNLHKILNVENRVGLADYLAGDAEMKDIIKETKHENLYIITAGKMSPNPAEMIGSTKMKELIHRLRSYWDMTIYDAPPLQPVTDSLLLCKYIDYIVLSTFSKRTKIDGLLDAIKEVQNTNEQIGGVVLTGIKKKEMKYRYKKYYKYEEEG